MSTFGSDNAPNEPAQQTIPVMHRLVGMIAQPAADDMCHTRGAIAPFGPIPKIGARHIGQENLFDVIHPESRRIEPVVVSILH